mmetsp:Transcript_108292/g.305295  ORF Transcript_108292/g.305295 Transcript_108292/m.305295 type:complete len:418 (+) Transcript_108292:321-1574(+)
MRIIWTCVGTVFLYATLILLFFACAREEAKTYSTVYTIVSIILTALGLALLMLSVPLAAQTLDVYQEIFSNCQFGPRTQRLYEYSTVLQGIRATPECQTKESVSMCDGYQESMPYTGFLKDLEGRFGCAGFCFGNSTSAAAAVAVAAEPEMPPPPMPEDTTETAQEPAEAAPPAADASAPSATAQEPAMLYAERSSGDAASKGEILATALHRFATEQEHPEQFGSPEPHIGKIMSLRLKGTIAGSKQDGPRSKGKTEAKAKRKQHKEWRPKHQDAAEGALSLLQWDHVQELPAAWKGGFAGFSKTLQAPPGPDSPVETLESTTEEPGQEVPEMVMATPGRQGMSPPSLFSDAAAQASCDGMAARSLKFKAFESAQLLYYEGVFLIICVLVGALVKICGLCVQHPRSKYFKGSSAARL